MLMGRNQMNKHAHLDKRRIDNQREMERNIKRKIFTGYIRMDLEEKKNNLEL